MKTATEIDQDICKDESISTMEKQEKIAKLAYLKAKQRGFVPGHEIEDWLLAEREVLLSECSHSYAKPKRNSNKKVY